MKRSSWFAVVALIVGLVFLIGAGPAEAKKLRLKISHQFAEGDVRDKLCRVFAEKVQAKLGQDVKFRIYPAKSLFKPKEQWDAMKKGALDMSLFPLDYASGKVPQFSITLMPCSVSSMKQAHAWGDKPIGKKISQIAEANGVKILVWAWLNGGMGSTAKMIKVPGDVKGLKMRAAGKKFEYMLKENGASITSMPSSEIYHALATGVLDSCMTSTGSFVSYRLYEQTKFINIPRDYSIWYMAEPLCISLKSWKRLSPAQQKAFQEVAADMAANWVEPKMSAATQTMIDAFTKAGVKIHYMTKPEFDQWLATAKATAWKNFAETVKGGQELLDLALQAMN